MQEIYKPDHFKLYELVDPYTYETFGQFAWQFLDPRAVWTLDMLRKKFGKITVNDWKWEGKFKYSGFRPFSYKKHSKYSQHRFGRAFDCKFHNHTPNIMRSWFKKHKFELDQYACTEYITVIEKDTPTWFHFDVRAKSWSGIKYVPYK